jgi:uncharacterized protein (TIGR00369 family)
VQNSLRGQGGEFFDPKDIGSDRPRMLRSVARFSKFGVAASVLPGSLAFNFLQASTCDPALASKAAAKADHDEFTDLDLSGLSLDHHLIHSGLAGEERVHAYKLSISSDKTKLRATARLGSKVCGHPAVIHGGALSVLLDDAFGTLFLATGRNGFTGNLNVNFRKPVASGTTVRIEAAVLKSEPSKSNPAVEKVTMGARIVDEKTGVLYTEATALFISKEVPSSGGKTNKFFPQAPAQ